MQIIEPKKREKLKTSELTPQQRYQKEWRRKRPEKLDEKISQGYVSERLGQTVTEEVRELLDSLSLEAEKELT